MGIKSNLFAVQQGATAHANAGTAVTTPDATDDTTAVALANALRSAMATHFADAVNPATDAGAHGFVESFGTSLPSDDGATSTTLPAFIARLVAAWEDHCRTGAPVHYAPDFMNAQTDTYFPPSETYLYRRLNRLKYRFNSHVASAMA